MASSAWPWNIKKVVMEAGMNATYRSGQQRKMASQGLPRHEIMRA